ncbi:MAG: HAMP domain-containing histidine kinase [Clostridiales bacterium]|nr:HAMP domain-containing histidine kinase [Clostridiales bacterium]
MSKYWRFTAFILAIYVLLIVICNGYMLGSLRNRAERQYMVDINRAVEDIKGGASVESVSEKYDSITRAALFDPKAVINSEFVVKEIDHDLYIFEYREKADIRPLIYMNIGLGIAIISASCVLIYIGRKILRPFHKMSDYSVELARGNLSAPVKEDKNKFFGKFLWGINMLRDNLESNKERELELQKDKKTLILSLSHDIKTPLSAIKLYSRALDENIYETDEERKNAISGIGHNAEEIEKYVSDIVAASKEDFLNLEAEMKEFYLAEVMDRIRTLYAEKFKSLRTDFTIGEYSNVLLSGDPVRLEEVLQNLLENAIKYGSGRYVRIEFSDEEDCRLITVRNSGCSVKEEEIPHLFESFYRGSNSENVKGSGLGLFIARSLMRMMNGEIFAKIVPSDEGSDKENAGDFAITVVVRKA